MLEQIRQNFWTRWAKEYVSELQQRIKWQTTKNEIKKYDLVLVKDDHLPPLFWKLGRVTALHPGPDGITRVVTLRTRTGEIQRAVQKLCVLPLKNAEEEVESHSIFQGGGHVGEESDKRLGSATSEQDRVARAITGNAGRIGEQANARETTRFTSRQRKRRH